MPTTMSDGSIVDDNGIVIGYVDTPAAPPAVAPNPMRVQQDALGNQKTQAEIARIAATAPSEARKAEADARKAEAEAVRIEAEANAKQKLTPAQASAAQGLADDEILRAIADARRKVNGWSTGVPGQVFSNVGGTDARALAAPLSTIASRLTLDKLQELKNASATGASGLGSLTEKEGALLRDSVAGLDQFQSQSDLLRSLDAVEEHYRNMRALSDGKDYRDPAIRKEYGISTAEDATNAALNPSDPQQKLGAGATTTIPVPEELKSGVQGYFAARRGQQVNPDEFRAFYDDLARKVDYPTATPDSIAKQVEYFNKTGKIGGFQPAERQSTAIEGALSDAANSNVMGFSPGAYVLNAADALTMGNLDSMTADPARTRGGMKGVSDANPGSSIAGQIGGGVMGTLGVGKALGAASFLPGALRGSLAADALYGAGYGAGNSDDDRLSGAVTGGLAGIIGNKVGGAVGNKISGALRGVTDPYIRQLDEAGVNLTPGMMRGAKASATEERRMSNPFIGDRIRNMRRGAVSDWNQAVFDEYGNAIGREMPTTGQQGLAIANQASSDLYDQAATGMSFVPDAGFTGEASGIMRRQADNGILTPQQVEQVQKNVASNIGSRMRNGSLDGEAFKVGVSQMRSDAANMEPVVGQAVKEYRNAVMNAARRNSPPEAVQMLDTADSAYPMLKTLQGAVGAARNDLEEIFTPTQLNNAAFMNTKNFGGAAAAAEGRVPFGSLIEAGKNVLPNRIPNSGTAEREIANSVWGNIVPRAKALALAPMYSESMQPALRTLMMERPELFRAIGSNPRTQRLIGATGAPLALSYSGAGQ